MHGHNLAVGWDGGTAQKHGECSTAKKVERLPEGGGTPFAEVRFGKALIKGQRPRGVLCRFEPILELNVGLGAGCVQSRISRTGVDRLQQRFTSANQITQTK